MSQNILSDGVTPKPVEPVKPMTPAERKRLQRVRDREMTAIGPIYFETPDWKLFLDPAKLPQKAGCMPAKLVACALKELVDNALDAGGDVTLKCQETDVGILWIVTDTGLGINPAVVPSLFAINRPLVSNKLIRRPTRGALGNGLRVVTGVAVASGGGLTVETKGRRLTLGVNLQTGETVVTEDQPSERQNGTAVYLVIGPAIGSSPQDAEDAEWAITLAAFSTNYDGPSSPWWYTSQAFHQLLQAAPNDATVEAVCRQMKLDNPDPRRSNDITAPEATEILSALRGTYPPVKPERLGSASAGIFSDSKDKPLHYAIEVKELQDRRDGAIIPFVVQAWAVCNKQDKDPRWRGGYVTLFVNRTAVIRGIDAFSDADGLILKGGGMQRKIPLKAGEYTILVNLISPYIPIANDGKEPSLNNYAETIVNAVGKVCRVAHNAMEKPPKKGIKINKAAELVMKDAYMQASGNGTLPAMARQIYYAARPKIMELTGKNHLDDAYFTQTLLPDFMEKYADEVADWNVAYDDRGSLIEPHTGREIGLGTLAVESYVEGMIEPSWTGSVSLGITNSQYETVGPQNRYSAVLFIEKMGFHDLLRAAHIAERFDIAIMSTKGMSVVAARELLDGLALHGVRVFALHDFDISGFTILGTLTTDSRRYSFQNQVEIIDLGLRLSDVKEMNLPSEVVKGDVSGDATLKKYGATPEEVDFLVYSKRRVELNAMTSPQFVAFVERKLTEHGVRKVVPDTDTLTAQFKQLRREREYQRRLDEIRDEVRDAVEEAIADDVPADDLASQVRGYMEKHPTIPWDGALARLV